jgi:hypothetical protein
MGVVRSLIDDAVSRCSSVTCSLGFAHMIAYALSVQAIFDFGGVWSVASRQLDGDTVHDSCSEAYVITS